MTVKKYMVVVTIKSHAKRYDSDIFVNCNPLLFFFLFFFYATSLFPTCISMVLS